MIATPDIRPARQRRLPDVGTTVLVLSGRLLSFLTLRRQPALEMVCETPATIVKKNVRESCARRTPRGKLCPVSCPGQFALSETEHVRRSQRQHQTRNAAEQHTDSANRANHPIRAGWPSPPDYRSKNQGNDTVEQQSAPSWCRPGSERQDKFQYSLSEQVGRQHKRQ